MATDDLKARLLHGEGQDWDLPYATRKEAHDYIEALEAEVARLTSIVAMDTLLQIDGELYDAARPNVKG